MKLQVVIALLVVAILGLTAMLMIREQQSQKLVAAAMAREAELQRKVELLEQETASLKFNIQEKAARAAAPKAGGRE